MILPVSYYQYHLSPNDPFSHSRAGHIGNKCVRYICGKFSISNQLWVVDSAFLKPPPAKITALYIYAIINNNIISSEFMFTLKHF